MHRLIVLFLLSALTSLQVYSGERLVISRWLVTAPQAVHQPWGYETENTQGKAHSSADLLFIPHINLKDYFPEAGMASQWLQGQDFFWEASYSDENGYIIFGDSMPTGMPQVAYMAAYIRSSRWVETQLEIKSPYLLEAWLNGSRIGTKNSVETEENTIGKVSQKLKLPRGNHLLIIKSLRPAEGSLYWKVMANLEAADPFQRGDIQFGTDPAMGKDILHLMNGVRITAVKPSSDGTFYSIDYSRALPPSDQSETWTEIRRFSDSQLIHSFRHSRLSRVMWLPVSNAISYTTTREGKTTVHRLHVETGESQVLMEDAENFTSMRWSPDESYFIYSLREDGSGADAVMRQVLGMNDRQDQWRNRNFLYRYNTVSGTRTRLTYGKLSSGLQDISPDGTTILYSQSWPDYLERPYSRHGLYLLNMSTMEADTIYHGMRWGVSASFSPDGGMLLATGGPSALDGAGENVPKGMIPNNYDTQAYLIDLRTKAVTAMTREFDPAVSSACWHPLSNLIYLLTVDKDQQHIYTYNPQRARFQKLETGLDYISGMQVSDRAHTMTFLGNQANTPRKAYQVDLGRSRTSLLMDTESENYRHVRFGEVHNWDFTSSAGAEVTGRYYLPPDFDPEERYPLIVYYYGGTTPVGRTFGGRYPFNLWAGSGYVVYVLQPSGAIGFGQAFSAAHVNNWGITVADEIIEGTTNFLAAHPFINPSKVGCGGASYGGFMTMLLMTRTDMFAASFSHAGISSISSYWGEGYWGYSYSAEATAGSFPWNNPDIYIGQSPLFHAEKITTPMLLLTGDADTNVPPGESIQLFTALRILDRPVELLLVKGENHHIVTYSKRILWHNAIMGWFDKYLKDQPEWWEEQFPKGNY